MAIISYQVYDIVNDIKNTPAITNPRVEGPVSNDVTGWLINQVNANVSAPITQELKDRLHQSTISEKGAAIKAWVAIARPGGIWDYKPDISGSLPLVHGSPNITLGDITTNYQAAANINYGYTAAEVGLPSWLAQAGAGLYQYFSDDPGNRGGLDTWGDDPADNYWVKFGYQLNNDTDYCHGRMQNRDFLMYMRRYLNGKEPPEPITPGY